MRELLAIIKDVKAGVLPLTKLPFFVLWRLLRSVSEIFLCL